MRIIETECVQCVLMSEWHVEPTMPLGHISVVGWEVPLSSVDLPNEPTAHFTFIHDLRKPHCIYPCTVYT